MKGISDKELEKRLKKIRDQVKKEFGREKEPKILQTFLTKLFIFLVFYAIFLIVSSNIFWDATKIWSEDIDHKRQFLISTCSFPAGNCDVEVYKDTALVTIESNSRILNMSGDCNITKKHDDIYLTDCEISPVSSKLELTVSHQNPHSGLRFKDKLTLLNIFDITKISLFFKTLSG